MLQHITSQEAENMKHFIDEKYDKRIGQYDRHEKQGDTNVCVTMVIRSVRK